MNKSKKQFLLKILKTNTKIFKQQQKLVNRYQLLSEKQEKEDKLNKTCELECYKVRSHRSWSHPR